jgi:hypothetical protein
LLPGHNIRYCPWNKEIEFIDLSPNTLSINLKQTNMKTTTSVFNYFRQALIAIVCSLCWVSSLHAQAPNISYSSPLVLTKDAAITPLAPTNTGGEIPISGMVTTFAGNGYNSNIDGIGLLAGLGSVTGLCTDGAGNMYFIDSNTGLFKKINITTGAVTTLIGNGTQACIDGIGAAAGLGVVSDMVYAGNGIFYFVDNQAHKVRKIDLSTGEVSTLAGSGVPGSKEGVGMNAQLYWPQGLCYDGNGNLYVGNYGSCVIQKINIASKEVINFVGSGINGSVDGIGTAAQVRGVNYLTYDNNGNIYFTDGNIRKINIATRQVTTVAGSTSYGSVDGFGSSAKFSYPTGIYYRNASELYVCDNRQLRKVNTLTGEVTTVAGSGLADSKDGLGTAASFLATRGLVLIGNDLYMGEPNGYKIRKIVVSSNAYSISPTLPTGLSLNSTTGTISGTPTALSAATDYTVTGTNAVGSSSTVINLSVITVTSAPAISYPTPQTYIRGSAITSLSPVNTGGGATSYSISPSLPSGLSISTTTGIISGTPSVLSSATNYTVTATNAMGSTTAVVNITTVNPALPVISYTPSTMVFSLRTIFAYPTPTITGGPISTAYSISPALPTGIYLNTTTGAIYSSIPLASVQSATNYTVSVGNVAGTATTTVTISAVSPAIAPNLIYPAQSPFIKSLPIQYIIPTDIGGKATTFSVSPTLPTGLSIDNTGVISGTPTVVTPATNYTITATNGAGSFSTALTLEVRDNTLPIITYNTPQLYTVGTYTSLTPVSTGGDVVSYAISPALPSGLSFGTANGAISGTPTAVSSATNYTITATNSAGSSATVLNLSVRAASTAPSISYTAPSAFTIGTTITPFSPVNTGDAAASFSVSPALPAGLSINTLTGEIYGTPTAVTVSATYTVSATNPAGTGTANIVLEVANIPAPAISYATPPVYKIGSTIANLTPANTGGAATSYSVSPLLPAGLGINPATGVIYGTPTALSASAIYTVTATNTGGSSTATITISVVAASAPALSYSSPMTYNLATAITPLAPVNTGGDVVSYAVSPALPSGLSLNTVTGIISGTPTALTAAANYTVTATNSAGSASAVVNISVTAQLPAISYASPKSYTVGLSMTPLSPTSTGGVINSCTISPALPTGLSLSSTGMISGIPTAATAATDYTVTATNVAGSTTAVVNIATVAPAAPAISYAGPQIYTQTKAITALNPVSTGGLVVSYAISPALPTGLSMSTTTGVISGTPTVVSAAANYTITATNTGGSSTAVVNITVLSSTAAPIISYASPQTYNRGTAITALNPVSTGGAVTSYAVSPALPSGLVMSTTTGQIFGTPTAVTTAANYTVTATNAGGSTTATVNITVTGPLTWTGAAGTDWGTTGLWDSGSLPVSTSTVIIPNVSNRPVIGSGMSAAASSISVVAGSSLTVNAGGSLAAGTLTLNSDATGTAIFVNKGTATVTTAVVKQFLPNATARNYYLSAPVAGVSTAAFTGSTSVMEYNEVTGAWVNTTGTLTPGKGYISVATPTSQTFTFNGVLNDGNKSLALTSTAGKGLGFNLAGNPYPSYLDWTSLLAGSTNVEPTFWLRSKNAGNTAYVFDSYNNTLGLGTSLITGSAITRFIAPMQAFWVRVATGQTTGALNFSNAMRSTADVSTNRLKAPGAVSGNVQSVVRLRVSNGVNEDETILAFNANASNGKDAYDSPKMSNKVAAIPEIYTTAGGEELVINGMSSVTPPAEVALGFRTGESNTFSIKATEVSNLAAGTSVILKDNLLSTEWDLTDGTVYSFNSESVTTGNRFSVIFRAIAVTTGLGAADYSDSSISVYTNGNGRVVVSSGSILTGKVLVCNAVGQVLESKALNASVNVSNGTYLPGMYLVSILTNGKTITRKVIVR